MEPVDPNKIYDEWRAKFAEMDNINAIDYLLDLVLATNRRIDQLEQFNAALVPQVEQAFQSHGGAIKQLQEVVDKLNQDKPRLLLP